MGEPPAIEITITNLNDNVDRNFLGDLMAKCGPTEEQIIYYHPLTKRHLGIARCVFFDVRSAQTCVDRYNGKSVMGKVLNVFHDAFGEHCKQFVLEASGEKKPPGAAHPFPAHQHAMHAMPPIPAAMPPLPPGQAILPPKPSDEYPPGDGHFGAVDPYNSFGGHAPYPPPADNVDIKGAYSAAMEPTSAKAG